MVLMKNIYLLHGWTYTTKTWVPVIDILREHQIKVHLLQIPGLTDGTDKTWTLEAYVQWLKEVLGKEQGVTLVGHSNGGRIALAFSAAYPEVVEHLVLIDSAGILPRGARIFLKRKLFWVLAKLGKRVSKSDALRRLLYRIAREKDYAQASPAMRKTMKNLLAVDLRPLFKKIQVPTCIIWGEKDTSTPLGDGVLMQKSLPRSRLVVIPQANHSPQVSHPQEVADQIIQELSSV